MYCFKEPHRIEVIIKNAFDGSSHTQTKVAQLFKDDHSDLSRISEGNAVA